MKLLFVCSFYAASAILCPLLQFITFFEITYIQSIIVTAVTMICNSVGLTVFGLEHRVPMFINVAKSSSFCLTSIDTDSICKNRC